MGLLLRISAPPVEWVDAAARAGEPQSGIAPNAASALQGLLRPGGHVLPGRAFHMTGGDDPRDKGGASAALKGTGLRHSRAGREGQVRIG